MVRGYLVILSIVFVALQGCVAVQTFPTAARGGSTIALAIGSLDGADENNLTITFTPDAPPSTPVNLTGSI